MTLLRTWVRESPFNLPSILLLFVFSFSVTFFLMQGTPFFMYGNDVFAYSWEAKSTSWAHLFRVLFTDRISTNSDNPDYFYMGQGQRATGFIIIKGFFALDGMRTPQLRIWGFSIIFSLNAILLFLILTHLKVSRVLSFLGSMIYTTAVPTYSIISHIGDASLFYHFFTLLCFYLFFTKYLKQEKTNPFFLSVSIFISAMFAIKSNSVLIFNV